MNIRRMVQFDEENGIRHKKSTAYRMAAVNFQCDDFYKMATLRQRTQKGFHNAPKVVEYKVAIIGGAKNGEGKLAFEWVRVTESPLTANLSDDELYQILDSPLKCDYPCHSQSVEHGVALTSQCVKRRRTEQNQLVAIYQAAHSRKTNPRVVTYPKSQS